MIFRGERIRLTQFGQNNHPEFSSRDRSQHALHSEISLAVLAYNMLYRSDTKRPLAVVSKRYQVVQPRETERARLQIEQRES